MTEENELPINSKSKIELSDHDKIIETKPRLPKETLPSQNSKELSDKEIKLTEKQFFEIWNHSNSITNRKQVKTKERLEEIYRTQLPVRFFDDIHIIYCISLIEWIGTQESLNLDENPFYQGILVGKSPETYSEYVTKEFYSSNDVARILGIARTAAKNWLKGHKNCVTLKLEGSKGFKYMISKKIFEIEIRAKETEQAVVLMDQTIKDMIEIQQKAMKTIDEIDREKVQMIFQDIDKFTIDIKKCQDDCMRGTEGDCEFYTAKDINGNRSGCIYVRAHMQNIMNELYSSLNSEDSSFNNFIRKAQMRKIINMEARHRYMSLQQPYFKTQEAIHDRLGEVVGYKTCDYERELIKLDSLLIKAWKDVGVEQREKDSGPSADFDV